MIVHLAIIVISGYGNNGELFTMPETSGYTPEVFPVKPPEQGPMDTAKRKVFDFVKSQRPSEHARRTMETYDWAGDQLDGTSRELYEKLRPIAEKAAKAVGGATTAMEIALAFQVAAGATVLLGTKAGRIALTEVLKQAGVKYPKVGERVITIVASTKQGAGSTRDALKDLATRLWGKFKEKAPDKVAATAATVVATGGVSALGAVAAAALNRSDTPVTRPAARSEELTDAALVMQRQIQGFREFAQQALEKSTMGDVQQGRVAVIEDPKGSQVLLVRETKDQASRTLDPSVSLNLVDLVQRRMVNIRLTPHKIYGSSTTFTVDAFNEMTQYLKNGVIRMPSGLKGTTNLPFNPDVDLPKVTKFIASLPPEPQPAS